MQFDGSEFSSSEVLLCYYLNNTHEKNYSILIGYEADGEEQRRLSFALLKTGSLYNAIRGF